MVCPPAICEAGARPLEGQLSLHVYLIFLTEIPKTKQIIATLVGKF
jgi:hypothetical protein